jgi:predicted alpha/beta-fold hydrolase
MALPFQRHTLSTPDGDFLHLEILQSGNPRCAILVHGLEGSAESSYISSLAFLLKTHHWDVAALHLRGCSGTPNLLYRAYNSGSIDDLQTTIQYLLPTYKELVLVGFSLGGNIVLKYMGSTKTALSPEVKAAVGISVPCHLSSSCDQLESLQNWVYNQRFIDSLKNKLQQKMKVYPGRVSEMTFQNICSIRQLDEAYTAPSNGYANAEDYYTRCSSLFGLENVTIPTLLINAQDDPFLSPLCYPKEAAETNPQLHFYMPKYGGHVGFWPDKSTNNWKHEEWVLEFLQKHLTYSFSR